MPTYITCFHAGLRVGSRNKPFQLAKADHKLVRFYLPLVPDDPEEPVWSVIRKLSDKIDERVTSHMREIAKENPRLIEAISQQIKEIDEGPYADFDAKRRAAEALEADAEDLKAIEELEKDLKRKGGEER